MMSNFEIFEFFKDCPKELRVKCIEEVLIFGIRKIRERVNRNVTVAEMLNLNKKKEKKWEIDSTPNFKCATQDTVQVNNRKKHPSFKNLNENICPDTTCLPSKPKSRRTYSNQFFASTQVNEKEFAKKEFIKKEQTSDSIQNESQVIRMADEFLKNPFAQTLTLNKAASQNMFIDSHIFSTIEMNSPTATWNSDLI